MRRQCYYCRNDAVMQHNSVPVCRDHGPRNTPVVPTMQSRKSATGLLGETPTFGCDLSSLRKKPTTQELQKYAREAYRTISGKDPSEESERLLNVFLRTVQEDWDKWEQAMEPYLK